MTLAAHLGHTFASKALLSEALTHSGREAACSYERLEFLGDRVLGLAVSEMLFRAFPKEKEGALAKRHAALVSQGALARVAEEIGLAEHVLLAPSDEAERHNPSVLSDVCEAVIAALYLEGGLPLAAAFIHRYFKPLMTEISAPPVDAKTKLQEWAQAKGLPLPAYEQKERKGPAHAPSFTIELRVQGFPPVCGEGSSKKAASQQAAEAFLKEQGLA